MGERSDGSGPLRVVQMSFHADSQRRGAESLLRAWPALTAVASAVARAGVHVSVVQAAHRDELIADGGVEYHFVKDERAARPGVITRAVSLAPAVIHVQGFHHGRAVRRVTRAAGATPVLVQDHGGVEPHGLRRMTWRWAFASIHGAAFTVREQAAPWIESGVLRRELRVFDVLGGSSEFTPGDRDEARRATGMFGDPCLLWTGRLDANKDPLVMLDAVEQIVARLPDARLWCCFGQAPLIDAVRARIRESEALRPRVSLLGTRPHDQMELLYRAADFYLQTSHREGSGFSLLEAMSCGAVPIATDIPAARYIVGDAGSLTPVGDAAAMAAAVIERAQGERSAPRRAARARFESALTFDAIGLQLRSAYDALVNERGH